MPSASLLERCRAEQLGGEETGREAKPKVASQAGAVPRVATGEALSACFGCRNISTVTAIEAPPSALSTRRAAVTFSSSFLQHNANQGVELGGSGVLLAASGL